MRRLLILTLLALVTCKTSPYSGRTQTLAFSESYMNDLGEQSYAQMTGPGSKATISTDPTLTAPLLRVGEAISTAADKPDYKWEFKLIDDAKTANAWALPGGKIAFYTGIYPIVKDEAGMAIVMGHEVMHALLQHSNERMTQQLIIAAGMTAAAISLKDDKNRGYYLGLLGAGATVGYALPFSRKHESEADHYGLFLAAEAGYHPEAAIAVWERMAIMSDGKRPPVFLSTHPDPRDRAKAMRKWMPDALKKYEAAPTRRQNRELPLPPGTKPFSAE